MNDRPFSAARSSSINFLPSSITTLERTGERLRLLRRDRAKVLQVGLVADEHNDDVAVRVVAQLLEPARHVHVCCVLCNVVHEERAHCAAVVPIRAKGC